MPKIFLFFREFPRNNCPVLIIIYFVQFIRKSFQDAISVLLADVPVFMPVPFEVHPGNHTSVLTNIPYMIFRQFTPEEFGQFPLLSLKKVNNPLVRFSHMDGDALFPGNAEIVQVLHAMDFNRRVVVNGSVSFRSSRTCNGKNHSLCS